MKLCNVTFQGPAISDAALLERLPGAYSGILQQINGFIAFNGGFHLRGVCHAPEWHSLPVVWSGHYALHKLFPAVAATDIPFGQDCLGDQYLLRKDVVHRLYGESGFLRSMEMSFVMFLGEVESDAKELLGLEPLARFEQEGGQLLPGQLLSVSPPFITEESKHGVSLSAVSALERISFLADFARQTATLRDGAKVEISISE